MQRGIVRWLWRGRIPLGKVSIIEGDKACGKSTAIAWLAAGTSRGTLDGDLLGDPARVLIYSAEDDPSDTIRPRLEAQGADLERVLGLEEDEDITLPKDLEDLERKIERHRAKLVVFDVIASFLGPGVSLTSDTSIRRALGGLVGIARRTGAAIVLLRHLNRRRSAPAYDRGLGGPALGNLSREIWVMALHPDDGGDPNGRRVLAHVDGNLGESQITTSLEMSLDASRRLVIGPEVAITANDLLRTQPVWTTGRRNVPLAEVVAWLRAHLGGRWLPANDVLDAGAEHEPAYVEHAIDNARRELNVEHTRRTLRNPDGSTTHQSWIWLPGFVPPPEPVELPPPAPSPAPRSSPIPTRSSPTRPPTLTPSPTPSADPWASMIELGLAPSVGGVEGGVGNSSAANGFASTPPSSLPTPPGDLSGASS